MAQHATKPAAARKGGRPAFKPNDEQRMHVSRLKLVDAYPDDTIAAILGISVPTLRKHFGWELKHAKAELLGNVGGRLYDKAMAGDTTAMIFILKTQAGWRETDRHELTGADGAPLMPESLPPLVMVQYVDAPHAEGESATPIPA